MERCSRAEDDKGRSGRHHSKIRAQSVRFHNRVECSAGHVFKQSWGGALVLNRQTLERCSRVEEADARAGSRVQAKLGRGRRWSVAHV